MRMSRTVGVMVVLLLAVSVWNVGYDLTVPASTQSFRMHASDDLFDLVQQEQASLGERFDIYVLLGQIAGERTLFAPPGYLYRDRLDGLSDMRLVVDETGPVLTDAEEARLLALPGRDGAFDPNDEGIDRRLHIVEPSPGDEPLRLVLTDDSAIVVPESVLAEVTGDG